MQNDHEHRYFIFKTFEAFEPTVVGQGGVQLYEKTEYAVLGCNCGSVVKEEVKQL